MRSMIPPQHVNKGKLNVITWPIHTCPNKNNQPFLFLTDMSQFPIPPHCTISHDLDLNYDTGPSAETKIFNTMLKNSVILWNNTFFSKYDIWYNYRLWNRLHFWIHQPEKLQCSSSCRRGEYTFLKVDKPDSNLFQSQ